MVAVWLVGFGVMGALEAETSGAETNGVESPANPAPTAKKDTPTKQAPQVQKQTPSKEAKSAQKESKKPKESKEASQAKQSKNPPKPASEASLSNIEKIKKHIQKAYEEFYKDNGIKIESIKLELSPSTQINEVKLTHIALDSKSFLARGGVKIDFSFGGRVYNHLIPYEVEATLEGVFAQVGIKKSQDITAQEVLIKPFLLRELLHQPLSKKEVDSVSAKIFIPQQTLIASYQVEPKIIIRKNDTFLATYKEGGIIIQLVLIAKENGTRGAVIEALNPESKKSMRVRVLGNGMGEIL